MNKKKLLLIMLIATLVGAYFAFDLGRFFSLDYIKSQHAALQAFADQRPLQAALIYFTIYVAVTGLSLPGAAVMTLLGGAIFGLLWGTLIISFAASIGATLAFLAARFLLRDAVRARFGAQLSTIDAGIERDGAFYLFTLRLVPVFPFFAINLLMGLTPIRTLTFYWVSQIGMLAGTLVYVNAGTQLAQIDSLGGILSPGLLFSFALLGIFPLIAKKIVDIAAARKRYRNWPRPERFDTNMVVIGAGSGGLVAAYIAAAVKARVTVVEKHRMGGDCLNTGCVPSKALIRSAKFLAQVQRSRDYGIRSASAEFDFAEVMERVQAVIRRIEPHDSVERFTGLGVDVLQGEARITSPWTVQVGDSEISTRNIVIASGGRPAVPPIAGIEDSGYLTSDTLWELRQLPRRLVVLGGGPIGCELAQCFARFGSEVSIVARRAQLLPREDADAAALVEERFAAEGIRLFTGTEALACHGGGDGQPGTLRCRRGDEQIELPFDQLLVATGRQPNTEGLGLEALGIACDADGTLHTDDFLRAGYPNIYAVGDVAGPYQFTHTASHQAWFAAVNALFGDFKLFRADYSVIPWATFCEPEVARVGLNEREAKERGIACEVTRYPLDDLDRAIADGEAHGFVKVLTEPGKDRILGATIVGEHAGDLIAEYVTAMRHKLGMNKILGTIHIYPTLAEANKFAAGEWKKAHAPQGLLGWLAKYHRWRLG